MIPSAWSRHEHHNRFSAENRFGPRKGQCRVKLGQVSKSKILPYKTKFSSFASGLKKNIYFLRTTTRNAKNALRFTIAQPKIRILLRNFASVFSVCSFITYAHFFDKFKLLEFKGTCFFWKKRNLGFLDQNRKKIFKKSVITIL